MREKKENILFFILVVFLTVFGMITLIKTETLTSESENRSLATFNHFTLESFLDGSFQNNFEAAFSDQFMWSEEMRIWYNRIISNMESSELKQSVCANNYTELSNSVDKRRAVFNCEDYMVYFPEKMSDEQEMILEDNILKYNHINEITDAYYYFINDTSVYDFKNNTKVVDYVNKLNSKMTGNFHIAELDFEDYEGHKKYFYKTDHHLDYRGAFKVYSDIAKMFGVKELLKPVSTNTNHEYFFGSMAKNTKNYDIKEEFNYYEYEIPEHDTWINGEVEEYGNRDDYINHRYEYDKDTNYYAFFYGGDEGEVIFDFHQPKKNNLLVISNSYSNAVNELIATHFNRTYVVDLRHYKREVGEDFKLSEYIEKNKIDKVLLIMSPGFVYSEELNDGLEL